MSKNKLLITIGFILFCVAAAFSMNNIDRTKQEKCKEQESSAVMVYGKLRYCGD